MGAISPPPVYMENTSLTDLRTAELLVVTTLRLWIAGRNEPSKPALDWQNGFRAAGIEQRGIPAFGCFMDIIASTATRTIWLRPLRCLLLGNDEARLLQLISLFQRDRIDLADAIMEEFLPPAAVRLAERVGHALASALKAGKLMVPLRHGEAADYHRLALNAHAMPGLALVQ